MNFSVIPSDRFKKEPKLPKGFTVDSTLTGKYDDQPLFKDKVDRANHILKTVGLPRFNADLQVARGQVRQVRKSGQNQPTPR